MKRSRSVQDPHSSGFGGIERVSDIWRIETRRPDYMIGRVSHDARSVLTAMSSNVDWLRSTLESAGFSREVGGSLLDIDACCERLHGLLEDALVLARPDGLRPQCVSGTIGTLTARVLQRLNKRLSVAGVRVKHEGDTNIIASLDRSLLARVVERLIEREIEDLAGAQLSLFHGCDANQLTLSLLVRACRCSRASNGSSGWECRCVENTREAGDSEFCETIVQAHGGTMAIRPAANVRWSLRVPLVPPRCR